MISTVTMDLETGEETIREETKEEFYAREFGRGHTYKEVYNAINDDQSVLDFFIENSNINSDVFQDLVRKLLVESESDVFNILLKLGNNLFDSKKSSSFFQDAYKINHDRGYQFTTIEDVVQVADKKSKLCLFHLLDVVSNDAYLRAKDEHLMKTLSHKNFNCVDDWVNSVHLPDKNDEIIVNEVDNDINFDNIVVAKESSTDEITLTFNNE